MKRRRLVDVRYYLFVITDAGCTRCFLILWLHLISRLTNFLDVRGTRESSGREHGVASQFAEKQYALKCTRSLKASRGVRLASLLTNFHLYMETWNRRLVADIVAPSWHSSWQLCLISWVNMQLTDWLAQLPPRSWLHLRFILIPRGDVAAIGGKIQSAIFKIAL